MDRNTTPQPSLADFAQRYIDFLDNEWGRDERARYSWFDDSEFPKQCRALGFEMDCGQSFIEAYGQEAFNSTESLRRIIDGLTDIKMVGSAIFSQWRYFNHWANSAPTDDNIRWFQLMFRRLKQLA